MSTIFRVKKTGNYTVMSNCHLRDKNLSMKSKGLLSVMLSLPDDWDYSLKGLAHISKEGMSAISGMVSELEQAGYVIRQRERDKSGRLGTVVYTIYECPRQVSDNNDSRLESLDANDFADNSQLICSNSKQEIPVPENQEQEKPVCGNSKQEKPICDDPKQEKPICDNPKQEKPIADFLNMDSCNVDSLNVENAKQINTKEISIKEINKDKRTTEHHLLIPLHSVNNIHTHADERGDWGEDNQMLDRPDAAKESEELSDTEILPEKASEKSECRASGSEERTGCKKTNNPDNRNVDGSTGGIVDTGMKAVEDYRNIIKQNIGYRDLIADCSEEEEYKCIDEIVDVMAETVGISRSKVYIAGAEYPYELVKSKFLKLKQEHIRNVLDGLKYSADTIRSRKAYVMTCLFNASSDLNIFGRALGHAYSVEKHGKDPGFPQRDYDMVALERELLSRQLGKKMLGQS